MSKKLKYYSVYGKVSDEYGNERYVTVVGKLELTREQVYHQEKVPVETKPNKVVEGVLTFKEKELRKKLTLGMAICHPEDEFSEEKGVRAAKRKIESGDILGSLETSNVTMLTEDAVMAELLVKLTHIGGCLWRYLPEQ